MRWLLLGTLALSSTVFASTASLPDLPVVPGAFKFALKSTNSSSLDILNPGVLVGFNPQPDPPGLPIFLDVANPLKPAIETPSGGDRHFRFLFGLSDPPEPDTHWSFVIVDPPEPDDIAFDVLVGNATAFHVVGHSSIADGGHLAPGSLVGFNPQPDPPGFAAIGFDLSFNPVLTISAEVNTLAVVSDVLTARIDFQMTDAGSHPFSFTPVPLPASVTMLIGGVSLLGLTRARRRACRG